MVYLVKSAGYDGIYFKVGYTTNIVKRILPYVTHNPSARLLETIETYSVTKRQLESKVHTEIEQMGYQFHTVTVFGKTIKTEWFLVPFNKAEEFEKQGLTQFKSCYNRKIYKN